MARIDKDAMKRYNITSVDVIEIKGKKKTPALCYPLFPIDDGKNVIRINAMIRNNLQSRFGDKVTLKKINSKKVVLFSLKTPNSIDDDYLSIMLEDVPLRKGMQVQIPHTAGNVTFEIDKIMPSANAALIGIDTIFEIKETKK